MKILRLDCSKKCVLGFFLFGDHPSSPSVSGTCYHLAVGMDNDQFQDDVIASPNLSAFRKSLYVFPDGEKVNDVKVQD
ncbi:hypothetical protein OUZ56_014540 [Daphnia magna]|uniref:Uncharacterized protein n=1 Tax=Daphnia magna TaxID=35525 RepID=A0ABR0AK35_9CRUS|nr:hypothetical protein OUZ56_014540 [Daphnia magna]